MTTGIIPSIAVPHCRIDTVRGVAGAIGISRKGIDYDSLDGKPVHFVFMLICNSIEDALHLEVLKNLSVKLENPSFMQSLSECKTADEVYNLLGKTFY